MDLPAGLVKVGEGREAEMFALDDERVLRLYRGGFLRSSAEFQVQALEAARSAGIRVPAVYETTEVDGRVAVVMERIPGPDLLTVIGRQPWRVWWIGRVEGEAHAALGSAIAPAAFPTTHERYERKIRGSDAVPPEMAEAAIARLKTLPEGDHLLHGDFHHDNVLDGGDRGWLAIDPKGLSGERGFEYANLFRNPDVEIALDPARLRRRAEIVAAASDLEPRRLLQWVRVYAVLGAAWSLESGHDPAPGLAIGALAAAELG